MNALEINDLFEQESPAGRLYVTLHEMGLEVEREWMVNEGGLSYTVDLALPAASGWPTPTRSAGSSYCCTATRLSAAAWRWPRASVLRASS